MPISYGISIFLTCSLNLQYIISHIIKTTTCFCSSVSLSFVTIEGNLNGMEFTKAAMFFYYILKFVANSNIPAPIPTCCILFFHFCTKYLLHSFVFLFILKHDVTPNQPSALSSSTMFCSDLDVETFFSVFFFFLIHVKKKKASLHDGYSGNADAFSLCLVKRNELCAAYCQ